MNWKFKKRVLDIGFIIQYCQNTREWLLKSNIFTIFFILSGEIRRNGGWKDAKNAVKAVYGGNNDVKDYELTWEEHASLVSGDVRWIEAHIGKLDKRLRT